MMQEILSSTVSSHGLSVAAQVFKLSYHTSETILPGPLKYVKSWPFELVLVVLGHYFTYFGGPGIRIPYIIPIKCRIL